MSTIKLASNKIYLAMRNYASLPVLVFASEKIDNGYGYLVLRTLVADGNAIRVGNNKELREEFMFLKEINAHDLLESCL